MRELARMALGAAALWVGLIASAPVSASDIPSFREWIAGQDVALYVFDRSHSTWTVHREWLADDGVCGLSGTFRFRRLHQLQGRLPRTLTVRITSRDSYCPAWWFIDNGTAPPLGRWIVTDYDDSAAWWRVSAAGHVARGFGAGGPDTFPSTLTGWYRALRLPDTAIDPQLLARSDAAELHGGILAAAGVTGLVIWIRRRASRTATCR
jgi:hypothetical protein